MARFQFLLCPVLSSVAFAEITLANVQFTQSVDGKGTTLTGDAYLSETQPAETLKSYLNYPGDPKAVAIYVKYGPDSFLWGGVIQSRLWDKEKRAFTITATSWKAWLYQRFLPPDITTNPVTDILYSYTNKDQLDIARNLVGLCSGGPIGGVPGTPLISSKAVFAGVNRDLNFWSSEFIYVGDLIDRMADRENGFEWDVDVIPNQFNGVPELWFVPSYPKRQVLNDNVHFKSTEFGGNILSYDSPDDTAETVVTRVWGTGAGTAGTDLLVAYDQDQRINDGSMLLVETKEYANSGTTNIDTIASHVQGIRAFHASGLQQINIRVSLTAPAFEDYNHGDKVRLIVRDEILDIDFNAVRIVRRTFNLNMPNSEDYLDLLLDLNDTNLPQDEEVA